MTKQEAILECRRRIDAGEFNRKIVRSEPNDLRYDMVHLSCGHSLQLMPRLVDLTKGEIGCSDCQEEWIKANTEAK